MGGIGFSTKQNKILQTFVGSCVAVCIYDSQVKIAGMAHVMLPKNTTLDQAPKPEGKFADIAIKTILEHLSSMGTKPRRLEAKMAGGASVFHNENNHVVFNIGMRNINTIRTILAEHKISLVSEDVGASTGRWVAFDTDLCQMTIKDRKSGVRVI
jgi:chemotaxis protein CheD